MMSGHKALILLLPVVLIGCDWFDDPVERNLPPDTVLLGCGPDEGVVEGDDVRFVWLGEDIDGEVTGCEWSYDDGVWEPCLSDTIEILGVTVGEHVFRVRARDDYGDVDPTPAECAFTASIAGRLVDRVVLIELFTWVGCRYCPNSETALNAMLDDLGPAQISVIAYHGKPEQDRLATPETAARIDWYTDNPAFPVREDIWPTVVFDGLRTVVGAENAGVAEGSYRIEVAARAETGSPISLRLSGGIGADRGDVAVVVRAEDMLPGGSLVLRCVVTEDDVPVKIGFADEYDFVTRLLLEDGELELASAGDSVVVEREFAIDASWKIEHLNAIAFVQNTQTMEVVQSGRLKLE